LIISFEYAVQFPKLGLFRNFIYARLLAASKRVNSHNNCCFCRQIVVGVFDFSVADNESRSLSSTWRFDGIWKFDEFFGRN